MRVCAPACRRMEGRRQDRHRSATAPADVAVIWPIDRGPILVTTYVAEATAPVKDLEAVFAEVAKIVAGMVGVK